MSDPNIVRKTVQRIYGRNKGVIDSEEKGQVRPQRAQERSIDLLRKNNQDRVWARLLERRRESQDKKLDKSSDKKQYKSNLTSANNSSSQMIKSLRKSKDVLMMRRGLSSSNAANYIKDQQSTNLQSEQELKNVYSDVTENRKIIDELTRSNKFLEDMIEKNKQKTLDSSRSKSPIKDESKQLLSGPASQVLQTINGPISHQSRITLQHDSLMSFREKHNNSQ